MGTEVKLAKTDDPKNEQIKKRPQKNVRLILAVTGSLCLALGIMGIFLPVLPTTPFLLLAAGCYARSSERFYFRLLNNRLFGNYIKNYRAKLGIPLGTKVLVLIFLWATILFSVIAVLENLPVRVLLLVIALGVTIHILSIRTYRE